MRKDSSTPSRSPTSAANRVISPWISNAARHARTAWSSNARGAPNTAMTPSPVNLSDRAAIPLHHHRRTVDQFGHDLAQPLRTHRRRDVHRMHHVGEQHRHLLVLRRCGGVRDRRTALVAELGVRRQFGAARPTRAAPPRSVHRHHPRWGPRQYRFTAGQRCPSYRRLRSSPIVRRQVDLDCGMVRRSGNGREAAAGGGTSAQPQVGIMGHFARRGEGPRSRRDRWAGCRRVCVLQSHSRRGCGRHVRT